MLIDPKLAEQFEEYRLSVDKRLRKMTAEQLAEEEAFFAERFRDYFSNPTFPAFWPLTVL